MANVCWNTTCRELPSVIPLYEASSRTTATMKISPNNNTLTVSSAIFDVIDMLGPGFTTTQCRPRYGFSGYGAIEMIKAEFSKGTSKWETCIKMASTYVPRRYSAPEQAKEVCRHCLVGGKTVDLKRASRRATRKKFRHLQQLYTASRPNRTGKPIHHVPLWIRTSAEALGLETHLASSGRCFFVTGEKWIGLALLVTMEGDVIYVIEGVAVSFALRRERCGHQLVGNVMSMVLCVEKL
jgi:hypothetical protein